MAKLFNKITEILAGSKIEGKIIENIEDSQAKATQALTDSKIYTDTKISAIPSVDISNKVDKIVGKQLSTEDFTTVEKTKLTGIATGANNYVHPSTHPASIIVQDATNRFMTDVERTKLTGIATGATNYIHPSTHPASIIVQDSTNRFSTDTEKTNWNGKETTTGAQTKATKALDDSKIYTDTKVSGINFVGGITIGNYRIEMNATTGNLEISVIT